MYVRDVKWDLEAGPGLSLFIHPDQRSLTDSPNSSSGKHDVTTLDITVPGRCVVEDQDACAGRHCHVPGLTLS